jgi:hypothetical protein
VLEQGKVIYFHVSGNYQSLEEILTTKANKEGKKGPGHENFFAFYSCRRGLIPKNPLARGSLGAVIKY